MIHPKVIAQHKIDNIIEMIGEYQKRINDLREQLKKFELSKEQKEKIIKILTVKISCLRK